MSDRPHRPDGSSARDPRESREHRGGGKGREGRPSSRGDRPGGNRRHSQRAGGNRQQDGKHGYNPNRRGFREERLERRAAEPDLPEGLELTDLDPMILQDLRVLSRDNADAVAGHILMAVELLDDDPDLALRHARAAKDRAGRVGVAREINGVVAYRSGQWKEALAELRAARRISGGPGLLALMADCERGLGRPEKAVELGRSEEARQLDPESRVELGIVVAGARADLGQHDSALVTLERLDPSLETTTLSGARLCYAYGDALLAVGRRDEAKTWFEHAAQIDTGETTDAAERVAELS